MDSVRDMSLVRRAAPDDAAELLRLRQVMIDSMPGSDPATDWHAESLPTLRERLTSDDDFGAFVVDHPERPGTLAALVVGTVDYRIGKAENPRGKAGFVFSVATDPDARRRGYARVHGGAAPVVPRARGLPGPPHRLPDAEPLYASLGFTRKPDPMMGLML